jgi:hypothetical protein
MDVDSRMIWFRAIGLGLAAALLSFASLDLLAEFVRPQVQLRDIYGSRAAQARATRPPAFLTGPLWFDGDYLASYAATLSDAVLNHPVSDPRSRAANNAAAQRALTAALEVSPLRPIAWLALSSLKALEGAATAAPLKLSYLTGSIPADLAYTRLQLVTSTSAASDEEIGQLAQADIRTLLLADRTRYEAPLIAAYVQATPDGRSLLLSATAMVDPNFSAMLKQR